MASSPTISAVAIDSYLRTGEGDPDGVVRHHRHRKRYRHLRGFTSSPRGGLQTKPRRSRRRRRRGIRRIRYQATEASTRDVSHPSTIFSSWRTDKLRRKRVQRHKRERQKEQECSSGLITFFRNVLYIEVTNPYTVRAQGKSGWRTRSA